MEVLCAEQPRELTVVERANQYRRQHDMTIADLAREIGYSREIMSLFLSGKYKKNPANVTQILTDYLDAHGADTEIKGPHLLPHQDKGLFESVDARNVIGVCKSTQEYSGLGIVVGRSGYGKTFTLRQYAKFPKVVYLECDEVMSTHDLLFAIETALEIPRTTYKSAWKKAMHIREFFNVHPGHLLILDEADKLINSYSQKKIEMLRSIYDQSTVGLVLAGEPALKVQIETVLPRLANRFDFYAELRGLRAEEVKQYLGGFDIDEAALKELTRRACNERNGCFRLLDRTLKNVFRLLEQQEDSRITLNIIDAASDMMML